MDKKCVNCNYVHLPEHHENFVVGEDSLCPSCRKIVSGNKGLDNYGRPRINQIEELKKLNDNEYIDKVSGWIYMSAFCNNNPIADWHWLVDAAYAEAERRGNGKLYDKAWKLASN